MSRVTAGIAPGRAGVEAARCSRRHLHDLNRELLDTILHHGAREAGGFNVGCCRWVVYLCMFCASARPSTASGLSSFIKKPAVSTRRNGWETARFTWLRFLMV